MTSWNSLALRLIFSMLFIAYGLIVGCSTYKQPELKPLVGDWYTTSPVEYIPINGIKECSNEHFNYYGKITITKKGVKCDEIYQVKDNKMVFPSSCTNITIYDSWSENFTGKEMVEFIPGYGFRAIHFIIADDGNSWHTPNANFYRKLEAAEKNCENDQKPKKIFDTLPNDLCPSATKEKFQSLLEQLTSNQINQEEMKTAVNELFNECKP